MDVAHKKYIAKNLLIQAEDARLYNEYVIWFLFIFVSNKKKILGILVFIRNDLTRIYSNLNRLNEDMASSYRIRQQNFVEMQKNLDAVNSVLKSSIRLRGKIQAIQLSSLWLEIYDFSLVFAVGKYAAKMMPLFKIAVKNKNVQAIVRIIEIGEN